MLPPYCEITEQGLLLYVRVLPGASRNAIEGIITLSTGKQALKLRTTTVPEKGRANKAVIQLLAKNLGVSASSFSILHGITGKDKTLLLSGEAKILAQAVTAWESARHPH